MSMKRIRLELARNKQFPNGSPRHGYDITAPLDPDGHLDALAWKKHRADCHVRRFWAGEPDQHGLLVRRPGGAWMIDYDKSRVDDDEAGFKFSIHRFVAGEYVSITEHDGEQLAFRIASVIDEADLP